MNYEKIYKDLIFRAQNRILEGYGEVHHIIPRCLGGTDDAINLVKLTAEEHYVAHQILAKLNPEHHGLVFAAIAMSSGHEGRSNNKVYGWLKRRHNEFLKAKTPHNKGKTLSEETRAKMSAAKKGKPPNNKGGNRRGAKMSDEAKAKMSAAKKGKPISEKAKAARIGQTRNRNSDGTFTKSLD